MSGHVLIRDDEGNGSMPSTPRTQNNPTPSAPAESAPTSQSSETERVKQLEAENAELREQLTTAENLLERAGSKEPAKETESPYVTALVDALVDGKPLAFAEDVDVPADVERRLRAAGRLTNRPVEPSFGMSEGQRAELEATGKTTSPFTGTPQVGTGKPGSKPRAVSAEEFAKTPAKPQAPARNQQ